MSGISRRQFVKGSAAAGLAAPAIVGLKSVRAADPVPVVISSANGLRAVESAYNKIKAGMDTLEAIVSGVAIVEDDPEDNSVGYGGLPNEDGVVELDASVMHGPSARCGAVGGLRDVKNPAAVAYQVMKRTDHVMLVGEGALRFALAHGFKRENLLTEKSRMAWLAWKETMSDKDSWGPGLSTPDKEKEEEKKVRGMLEEMKRGDLSDWVVGVLRHRPTGTLNCLAINERGDLSGSTTTSGLAWKLAGRVGDSPLIGSGLFVDNSVGGSGSTGRGEENIRIAGGHTIVEMMRRGASPTNACLEACKRVAANYGGNEEKLMKFNMIFYALNKKGEHGSASLWSSAWRIDRYAGARYAVCDEKGARLVNSAFFFDKPAR